MTDTVLTYNPDIIVCIVGGNSVASKKSPTEVCSECRQFYELLRSLSSKLIIVSAQIELRYYTPGNRFGSPTLIGYKRKRNSVNRFLDKLKVKDHVLMIGGPARLDHKVFYKADGVHLNKFGIKKYMSYIYKTIQYLINLH